MIRLSALLCLLVFPALSQGTAVRGLPAAAQSSVRIIVVNNGAHVATIMTVNESNSGAPDNLTATISVKGVPFGVRIAHRPCDQPDRYTVLPPEGFVTVPVSADVPERGHMQFLIHALVGMPLV